MPKFGWLCRAPSTTCLTNFLVTVDTQTVQHPPSYVTKKNLLRRTWGREASRSFGCFVGSCNLNLLRYKRDFFAAFGAFAIVILNYLVWRLQLCAFVENIAAFFANYLLRHGLTATCRPKYKRHKLFIHYDEKQKRIGESIPIVYEIAFCEL
jgi:hypothetical protein